LTSATRQLARLLDKRLGRRLILAPLVAIASFGGVVISPLVATIAAVRDVVRKRRRLPTMRLAALVLGAAIIETIAMAVTFALWIATGFNQLGPERWRWHLYRPLMGWYTATMLSLIARVLGTHVVWRDHADLSRGPVVLIARHTSFFDAMIPATVLSQRNGLLAHHIVTHGLRYSPCIDIAGSRFPNRFVKRTPGEGSAELGPIEEIGKLLDDRSAAVIFPEGTFRNPERFERSMLRLDRRRPDLATRAQSLDHVLPPRAGGTFALLQGAPDADLVVCTNTGLERFGSIKDIVDHPYTVDPIVIETWRIPRHKIPTDHDEFGDWLFDQYVNIDTWVADQHST